MPPYAHFGYNVLFPPKIKGFEYLQTSPTLLQALQRSLSERQHKRRVATPENLLFAFVSASMHCDFQLQLACACTEHCVDTSTVHSWVGKAGGDQI